MATKRPTMKMPELLVFARMFVVGFSGAEIFRLTFYLSSNVAKDLHEVPPWANLILILTGTVLCLMYAVERDAHGAAARIGRSLRIDLLAAVVIGIWSNELAASWLSKPHAAIKAADPNWALVAILFLGLLLLSPLVSRFWPSSRKPPPQLYFIADEEVGDEAEDQLANKDQAKSFAETVLSSGAHPGLVFGVDGPWGVGKTSFINLAERHWERSADKVIVCRFEPLRYASEPDLAERLIRDLSATIQSKVFAPEFRPAASRYSRLIKGKADISFLGFKLSLEPSQETVDELLDDIDEVLRRIGRRVIIVIDDLDRLDAKTANNVLFATRRTFKLSQATYILCYDTEVLTGGSEEGSRAREFLEKFVTVKLSLLVDSSSLRDFLTRDWQSAEKQLNSVPADTMVKLGSVLSDLAEILDGNLAANYLPMVGNLRKVKRFINAILLMQIEKTNFGRTDFNTRDLINLVLLHLNYPGLFRRIYAEETEGRSGVFSLKREYGTREFKNTDFFSRLKEDLKERPALFLLEQLFDVNTLNIADRENIEESVLRSRACFNDDGCRNLEGYLKLIVRFETPEPEETFIFYQEAVDRTRKGASIESVLTSIDFNLEKGEHTHDRFWRALVNQSRDFTSEQAHDAIETLVKYLPFYSAFNNDDRGLRERSIYSLLQLLDRAGWERTSGRRTPNSAENIVEIAWRLFGENKYQGKGLLERLVEPARGVLGWRDLMLFRLNCSADRRGQLYNLHNALIVHQDIAASTSGMLDQLAMLGMRRLSQQVFALFKRTYIDSGRNFLAETSEAPDEEFLGTAFSRRVTNAVRTMEREPDVADIAQRVAAARVTVKSFVIYQLSNVHPPNGSGVGCGFYDEDGVTDGKGIAKLMNDYVFCTCFNPERQESNISLFLDHCLSHLSNPALLGRDEGGLVATESELSGGLDPRAMGRYWRKHQVHIRNYALNTRERRVFTPNYTASYHDDLKSVFTVLDKLAEKIPNE